MGKKSKEGRAIKTSPHPSALSARSGSATANKCFKARFRIAHWRCTRSYLSVITIHFLAVYSTYFLSAGIKLCQVLYFKNPKACLRSLLFQFIQLNIFLVLSGPLSAAVVCFSLVFVLQNMECISP